MTDQAKPRWLKISDELLWPLVGMSLTSVTGRTASSFDLFIVPYYAGCHLAGCIEASMFANRQGKHSTSISLIRQSVEALTILELGLQSPEWADPIIADWKHGRLSHGQIRAKLEKAIWPSYGTGLWDESWSEYFGNLARAVQPYAHYTPELQGWQDQVIENDSSKNGDPGTIGATVLVGLTTYDPIKATRVTFLHSLLAWTLGRLLLAHAGNPDVLERAQRIHELGQELGKSKLLFHKADWGTQLLPFMYFDEKDGWRDV